MSTTKVFYPHAFYTGDSSLTLTQLMNVTPVHNYSDLSEKAPSQVAPQLTGSHQAQPDIKFTVSQLKTLLDKMIAGSFNCAVDLSATSVYLEYRRGKKHGTREAKNAGNHFYGLMDYNAMLTLESLTGQQGGLLEARCRLVSVKTDTAKPLSFVANINLVAVAQVESFFTIGPVKINGTWLGGIESWTFDNQISYEEVLSDGDAYPSYVGVRDIRPRLTVRTRHADAIATFGEEGTALSSLNLFARKKLVSGINVADATAQHLKLIATEGTVKAQSVDGDKTLTEVTVDLHETTEDTAPYSLNTASAIS